MTTITRQMLIRDFTQLLKTRGLRLAALGGTAKSSSDWLRVYTQATGTTLADPTASVFRIVIDMDKAVVDALDERAIGSDAGGVIPVPDRV